MRGKPLDQRGLARHLRQYGIKSRTVRIGEATPKGYERADFFDAWSRYIPPPPPATSATSATSATAQCFQGETCCGSVAVWMPCRMPCRMLRMLLRQQAKKTLAKSTVCRMLRMLRTCRSIRGKTYDCASSATGGKAHRQPSIRAPTPPRGGLAAFRMRAVLAPGTAPCPMMVFMTKRIKQWDRPHKSVGNLLDTCAGPVPTDKQ